MNIRWRIMQFMSGRYGADALFYLLFAVSASLAFINIFVRSYILQMVVYAVMVLAILRVFSRNTAARARENRSVLHAAYKIKGAFDTRRQRKADCTHIYKKCPHCRAVLRLPRKKGKHTTVCPRCGKSFRVRVYKDK